MKAGNEALSHTDWLVAKLAKSTADTRPRVSHEQVMSEAQAIIDRKRQDVAAFEAKTSCFPYSETDLVKDMTPAKAHADELPQRKTFELGE